MKVLRTPDDRFGDLPDFPFEPRYTEMIEDCLESGCTAMAVALLAPGWESHYEDRPAICEVAGAGRIVAHQLRPDGTHDVILHGLNRVRLHELPDEGRPYRCARAQAIIASTSEELAHPESMMGSARAQRYGRPSSGSS